jgi:hypothetical protein
MKKNKLEAGEWVEIRPKREILGTLDEKGQLEGLPFMPQMFQYCGKRFRVSKRAHKTCDTVFPVRGRRMANAVHLETRCDGQAYGGCQAGCLIFWKEAWLRRVGGTGVDVAVSHGKGCTEDDVIAGTRKQVKESEQIPNYVCQATQLPYATTDLNWWDIRQYLEDWISGNVGFCQVFQGLVYSCYFNLSEAGIGLGGIMRSFYDKFHPLWGGSTWPRKTGTIPRGQPTPKIHAPLNLQPGELVRVKPYEEILKTLNTQNKNQGLYFDAEMVPYCGRTLRVLKRVTNILDEKTGKMLNMKTPSIILDGAVCQSRYSNCRMFCPRAIYSYWREIWLERVSEPDSAVASSGMPSTADRRCDASSLAALK